MKKILSKILIMAMLVSAVYVPTMVFASNNFSLTITEDAFGIKEEIDINIKNKVKGSKYTWISSNEKIATVDKVGVVKGLKAGDVFITCIITTPDGETHEFTSDITINSKTKVTVVNQKQLEEALANEDVEQIIIKTSKEKEFVIPEGKYDKRLYMKASEADIINEGDFKSVHTYIANQEQLDKALANEKVTIITIVTDEEENFEIVGDHSRIRVIINAPEATVVNNAILRGVDVKKVNDLEEKVYVPEVKEEEKIEDEVVEEDVVTPPTGNSGGGGGGYFPPVNPQPSNPTPTPTPQPTEYELLVKYKKEAINRINVEVEKYDTSNKSDSEIKEFNDFISAEIEKINKVVELVDIENALDEALSNIKGFKTSVESALEQAKINAINEIESKKNPYRSSLPTRLKKGFDEMISNAISNINSALLIDTVATILDDTMNSMKTYHDSDSGNEEQMLAEQKADYDLYKAGEMTLESLYAKYAYDNEGYEYFISDNNVFFVESTSEFIYVDITNNKTYTFLYNEEYYSSINFTLEDYEEELLWRISNNNYLDVVTSTFDGFIVSFNPSEKTLAIVNLDTVDITFSIMTGSELTKWQDVLGRWYYGYPTHPSSQDSIRTDDGKVKVSTSTVSGSAITFDFKLYNNNTDGVKLVCFEGSQDELKEEYYTVINHDDNTANIIFNNLFVQEYIMTQTENKVLVFNIFPDIETYSNGTGITFDITVDHLKEE